MQGVSGVVAYQASQAARGRGQIGLVHRVAAVVDHQRIDLRQLGQPGAEGRVAPGRLARAPVVDGQLDVGDVQRGHGAS